jgi:predicted small lipoprotein YifL
MRHIHNLFVLVCFLAGCGSKGALYLPEGEKGEVGPSSIQERIEYGTELEEEEDQ